MARAGCRAVAFLAETSVMGMLGIHMRNCLATPASIFVVLGCFHDAMGGSMGALLAGVVVTKDGVIAICLSYATDLLQRYFVSK